MWNYVEFMFVRMKKYYGNREESIEKLLNINKMRKTCCIRRKV